MLTGETGVTLKTMKWGQLAGFGLMVVGVWDYVNKGIDWPLWFLAGIVVYAGFRIAAWMKD